MIKKWSIIVITCPTLSSVRAVETEVKFLKRKGRISEFVPVLCIEDHAKNIGSGAATLNALLVATEFLSVKNNYMVISSDVLLDEDILILHNGRDYLYSCCGKAFIPLPVEYTSNALNGKPSARGILLNFESVLGLIDELSEESPHGVWVCSTDMMIHQGLGKLCVDWKNVSDVLMFTVPSDLEYATGHGVVEVDSEGCIADIYYCASLSQIKNLSHGDEKVPLISGIVFFKTNVAESLLSLHVQVPLDSCTYLGLDSGNEPIQVSLFFDLLIAMSTKMRKEDFITGKCGKTYNVKAGFAEGSPKKSLLARSLVWKELSRYKMSQKMLSNCQHLYWSCLPTAEDHMKNLFRIATSNQIHSMCQIQNNKSDISLLVNSCIQTLEKSQISPGVVICDSHIETCSVNIGTSSYISGISYLEPLCALVIPKDLVVIKVFMQNDSHSELFVIFGIQENLMAPVDLSCSFFCNKPWSSLLEHLGVEENEIWNSSLSSKERRLLNAKLYSTDLSLVEALKLYQREDPSSREFSELVEKWKKHEHYSIEDILERVNYSRVFQNRRNMFNRVSSEIVKKALMNNEDLPLLPYYSTACCEELTDFLMDALDHVLLSDASSVIKTRALSHMADLLSAMAGITGGLRSGPGNNPAWTSAFTFLMNGNIIEGMKALQNERSNWLDRPDHIMRAARHYDRAAQILILISVKTVLECIILSPSSLPDIGTYITAECPARIDLQGGWSDTPPICYELGGSVVNVAVLIDGKKPIGARARRIIEPHILLKLGLEEMCHEVLIKDIKDVLNYDQPNAQGALLKAALLCTEIVNVDSNFTLSQQLMSKFNGGFEVQAWSLLPQGCGMGTSSILAGAIVSVLWTVSGKAFDKLAIVHAVLYVEQLLTTGGGWQDQVSGVLGGITRGYSEAVLPLCAKYEPISLPEELIAKLNSHLLLLYTGKVRLAKNLLQNVIRSWYAREEIVVNCFKDLISYSLQMKQALKNGDFYQVGLLMNKYWEQKKILAPGCEPATVKEIMNILSSLCYGQLLVGAGGGGFMCILTKEPNDKANIKAALHNFKDSKKLSIHTVNIDLTGLEIQKSP